MEESALKRAALALSLPKFDTYDNMYTSARLWRIFDDVFLLQMGHAYQVRICDFAEATEDGGLNAIRDWRKEQQEEWDRLSLSLALLGTMNAAILAISPTAPPFAFSVWLGSAGLSVCGLFVIQYFPIQAFSISDADMGDLIRDGNEFQVNTALLASAIASPVIIALWSSLLFIVGVVDYAIEVPFGNGGVVWKAFALLPIAFGVVTVCAALFIGNVISRRIEMRYKRSE